jgi:hypothetical protein
MERARSATLLSAVVLAVGVAPIVVAADAELAAELDILWQFDTGG